MICVTCPVIDHLRLLFRISPLSTSKSPALVHHTQDIKINYSSWHGSVPLSAGGLRSVGHKMLLLVSS